uniref:RNA-binding protein EWS n=1 Tax=Calidris pygmaea TaxID=425635 RepID=A0A8C3JMQ3_9CHAR
MASTDYSTYSQAAAQQGYSAYAPQPAQGYAQTTQTYGQSYGTYGQPTDVSYTQPQTTATYGQTAYATSYGQPPTGKSPPCKVWPVLGRELSSTELWGIPTQTCTPFIW